MHEAQLFLGTILIRRVPNAKSGAPNAISVVPNA
jgi:hypothetical protein